MNANQELEQVMHFPSMASSPATASGTLPTYFRHTCHLFLPLSSFLLSDSSSPFKRCRTLIHLTLLCSAYSTSFTLCPCPHHHASFSGSQGTSISQTMTHVDFAAKQSLLFTKITDPSLSPAYDLRTYYRCFVASPWHNTWHTQPLTKLRSIKKNPTPMVSSNRTSRHQEIIISIENRGYGREIH